MSAGLLYYSCGTHPPKIVEACQRQINRVRGNRELGVVSLKPISHFGDWNLVLDLPRCRETMQRQILAGLERMESETVFMVETDVLYHPLHFEFVPPSRDVFFYNEHTYKVSSVTGQAVFYFCKQLSGCCADRQFLVEHFRRRIARIERDGYYDRKIGFEPGTHSLPRGVDNTSSARWMSAVPNVDIRHPRNQTKTRWRVEDFRDKRTCLGWTLHDEVPGWGVTKGRFEAFLADLDRPDYQLGLAPVPIIEEKAFWEQVT